MFTALEIEVARQIAGLRAMAGLDQDQMGLARETYGSIERCERHADMAQLDAIVGALVASGCTDLRAGAAMADLIGRAESALRYRSDPGLTLP